MSRPLSGEYHPYFDRYIDLAEGDDIAAALEHSKHQVLKALEGVNEDKGNYKYGEGKWTLKEVLQHIIDTDVVFLYRALTFSREDEANLPGFEQNDWAANSSTEGQTLSALFQQFTILKDLLITYFKSFDDATLLKTGLASGNRTSVRAIGFISAGHSLHHLNIIKQRYL